MRGQKTWFEIQGHQSTAPRAGMLPIWDSVSLLNRDNDLFHVIVVPNQ